MKGKGRKEGRRRFHKKGLIMLISGVSLYTLSFLSFKGSVAKYDRYVKVGEGRDWTLSRIYLAGGIVFGLGGLAVSGWSTYDVFTQLK